MSFKCENYIICETIFNYNNQNLCINCNHFFGKLIIYENNECPICLNYTKCIKLQNCDHCLCVNCFKRCFCSWKNKKTQQFYNNETYLRRCSICRK